MREDTTPYLLQMPMITGADLYLLVGNTLFRMDDSPGIKFSDTAIDMFFQTGLWVKLEAEETEEECEGCPECENEDEDFEDVAVAPTNVQTGAIASDGRSSTYYDIGLPNWLIARVLERYEEGYAYIKTEELIEIAFHDDFDAGNAFKSLVRLWGAFNGAGKAGNSVSYEKNKIEYSVGKLVQRYERQGRTDW